jgi:pilus assembly protein CpaF
LAGVDDLGMEGEINTLQDVFRFDHSLGFDEEGRSVGVLKSTGLRPTFLDKLAAHGIYVDSSLFAFEHVRDATA